MRLKSVLAFVNNKGGVGKTTTVQSVASGILRKDPNAVILCIDIDAQGNLSGQLGWEEKQKEYNQEELKNTLASALGAGLDGHLPVFKKNNRWYYIPSCNQLEGIESVLNQTMKPKQMLGVLFGKPVADMTGDGIVLIQDYFDYVLIDCPPSLSSLTINALDVSDSVIIPVRLEPLAIHGLGRILNAVKEVNALLNPDLKVKGILPIESPRKTILSKSIIDILNDKYGSMLMKPYIRQCTRVQEAQAFNQDIFEYAPNCTTAMDYAAIIDVLINE